ncbi:MAG: flavoprotein [Promethearchaeota archaeon]
MSLLPQIPSFLFDQTSPSILWCYTGGGHFFDEIFTQILKLNNKSVPICFVFSNAGALVANRYGFFWKLTHSDIKKEYFHFIFEYTVAQYNIEAMLTDAEFSYSIIFEDPAFSVAIALANTQASCIIACPLTANTAAKLVSGIADSFISNLLSNGLKSGKKVVIYPTDAILQKIKTKLPVRQIKSTSSDCIDASVCRFNALKESSTNNIIFLPQFCVGCQACVKKYPTVFSFGDEIDLQIRKVDFLNIQKLGAEMTIFKTPKEIIDFVDQNFPLH